MSIIIPANSAVGGGFEVANSVRFNSGSSDSLTKTLGTPTNNKKWTYSFWVKQSALGGNQTLLNTGSDTSYIYFRPDNADPVPFGFSVEQYVGGFQYRLIPNMIFRDASAWRHIVIAFDTTQGTDSNRVKIYNNGTQITSFNTASYPSQNLDTQVNSAISHKIGGFASGANLDAYLSEVCFIDGQQLAADSFGEFDSDSGVWKPLESVADLTFGNNGFYLDFENSSALGNDAAGSNNFTVNNLTAIDQSTDTCTNNFNVMNPLDNIAASTFSEGNLKIVTASSNTALNTSSIGVKSGKWYWEVKNLSPDGAANDEAFVFGAITKSPSVASYQGSFAMTAGFGLRGNGKIWNGAGETAGWNSFTTNDIVSIAIDFDNGKGYFATNGSYGNSSNPSTGSNGYSFTVGSEFYRMAVNCMETSKSGVFEINFGGTQTFSISSGNTDGNGYGNFEYAVPSGYLSLCTANLSKALS